MQSNSCFHSGSSLGRGGIVSCNLCVSPWSSSSAYNFSNAGLVAYQPRVERINQSSSIIFHESSNLGKTEVVSVSLVLSLLCSLSSEFDASAQVVQLLKMLYQVCYLIQLSSNFQVDVRYLPTDTTHSCPVSCI